MSCYPTPIRDAKEAGFLQAIETAKDIALDMDIDTLFHTRRKIKRKRHFDEKFFGFIFISKALQLLDNKRLKSSCDNLEAAHKKDEKSDIDANELYMELKFI
jgi:hypothetical protein